MAPLDRLDQIRRPAAPADKETLMRVRMTEDRTAALDGIHPTELHEGVEYDLPADLASRYLERGAATTDAPDEKPAVANEPADEEQPAAEPEDEEKALTDPAPENRARPAPRRRK